MQHYLRAALVGGQLMAGWLLGRRMTHAVAPTVAPPPRLPHLLVRQAAGCGLQAAHAPCLWVVGVWCGSLAGTDPVCNRIACGAGELRAAVAAAAGACQQGSTDQTSCPMMYGLVPAAV